MVQHLCAGWRGICLVLVCLAGLVAGGVLAIGAVGAGRHWRRERISRWRRAWFRAVAAAIDLDVTVDGPGTESGDLSVDATGRGRLLAANHVSWLDIVALGAVMELNFVARADLGRWPVAGWLARAADTLFVRRGDAFSARCVQRRMAARLGRGESLCFFPEATTRASDSPGRFHRRLFRPAVMAGAAVVPVHVGYDGERVPGSAAFVDDDGLFTHLLRVLMEPGLRARLRFGSPVPAGGETDERRLAETVRQRVMALAPTGENEPAGAVMKMS